MPLNPILGLGKFAIGSMSHARRQGVPGVFVDPDPALRARVAAEQQFPVYETLEAALRDHPSYSGVHVATPYRDNAAMALRFAPWNVPVLMEKPMGLNKAECERVLEAYRKSRGWLQIDFEYRVSRLFTQADEILHSGELGDLRSIHLEYSIGPEPDKRGGFFREKLLNYIDLIRMWTRSEMSSIHVGAAPTSLPGYQPIHTDFVNAQYVMKNGVFVNIVHTNCSTAMPFPGEAPMEDWTDLGHRHAIYLHTTLGCLQIDIWKRRMTVIRRDPYDQMTPRVIRRIDHKHVPFNVSHHDMDTIQREFVRRVVAGEGPLWPLEDSFRSMVTAFDSDALSEPACQAANARFASP